MKRNKKKTITYVIIGAAVVLLLLLMLGGKNSMPKVEYVMAKVETTDISTTVTATGTIEPVTSVDVGTQVSGIVSKLYVDYNSVVKAGQVIAELDKSNLTSELNSARANLASAKASLASLESELNYQKENYQRQKTLHDKGLISDDAFDQAYKSYVQSTQSVSQQRQMVVQSGENVKKATTNLGYATITSPIDGVVLSKEVEEGQTVAASFNTPTLFKIARDLTDMRVIADVDEADIGTVQVSQRVEFTVDAYPEDVFEGQVTQVRQQATTENNVVTYQVVISAPNDDLKLKPGLTANVTIYTSEKKGVLAIPSKALRFAPNEALLADDETIENKDVPVKVWMKDGKVFKALPIVTGLTNGTVTEVVSGLKEGQEIISEFVMNGEDEAQGDGNPFMPKFRNRNSDKKQGSGAAGSGASNGAGGASGNGKPASAK
ncbi:MAG: efflux RND transporter periplasmic adaptor subunit [Bacteroidaceae bacterium]|nr:efflux RND transporter periplasmic adaptor subunit [Bacteroidaceae bacterium]MBP5731554.1 efflux RND transporter periplasmic adaptor subunit [Bacteroidaceae bacterium]